MKKIINTCKNLFKIQNIEKNIEGAASYLEKGDDKSKVREDYNFHMKNFVKQQDQDHKIKKEEEEFDKQFQKKQDLPQEPNQEKQDQKEPIDQQEINNENIQKIPFMITRQMKLDLIEKGYSLEQIKYLTPLQAQQILNEK